MKITKRNDSLQEFDKEKVRLAILSACDEVMDNPTNEDIINKIVVEISEENKYHHEINGVWLTVENISDMVEDKLMTYDLHDEAKRYIVYRYERAELRKKGWDMTQLQKDTLTTKYFQEGETFNDFIKRVGGNDEELMKVIRNKEFLFAGRILDGRGSKDKKTYSNCFVVPSPEDSIDSIFDVAKQMAKIYSLGGGVGVDLSKLRPNGARTNNSAKVSTGSISFGALYSFITGLIGQKARRGALMLTLDVSHPDIKEFINIKSDLDQLTKANISVKITDEFMECVRESKDFETKFYVEHDNGEVDEISRTYNARELFDMLAKQNHDYAEPGVLFWDRINNWYLLSEDDDYNYDSTNPCAEKPLPANSNCLLGSLNLEKMVRDQFTEGASFDFDKFKYLVDLGIKSLNVILDEGMERLPYKENKDFSRDYRPIGLGYFGYGNALIRMGMKYGTDEAVEFTHKLGDVMIKQALKTSALLAKENGSFPKFKKEEVMNSPFFKAHADEEIIELVNSYGLYNAELLSIAPTGSISILAGTSSGIEPLFKLSYTRKTESLGDGDMYYTHREKVVDEYMDFKGITDEDKLPDYFITAEELTPLERVKTQSAWQHYIDASISSTVNLGNEATVEDVKDVYSLAWEYGLKGITVFRDGCKRSGILSNHNNGEDTKDLDKLTSKELVDMQKDIDDKLEERFDEMDALNETFKKDPESCPNCGGELVQQNGCEVCMECSWSPCGL